MTKTEDVSAKERISKSKWRFLLRHPFLGELAMRLITKQDKLPNGSSMATDGRHLVYDEENINKIEHDFAKGHDPDVEDIIAHEVAHNIYRHVGNQGIHRQQGKILPVWIVACEYAVNHFVVDLCVPFIGRADNKSVLSSGKYFYDKKYADGNWTTEDIYWDLMQSDKVKFCSIDADGNVFDKDGNKIGKISDDHSKWGEGVDGKDGESQDQDWKIWVVQAAQNAKRQGKLPGDLGRFVEDITDTKLNWRHILAEFVLAKSKDDYSWRRLNKRHLHRGIFAPSLYSETIKGGVHYDTSGSMDAKEIGEGIAETRMIMSTFASHELHVFGGDAAIHHYQVVTPGEEIDVKGAAKGGGGTDHKCLFSKIEEENIDLDFLVCFTDGYSTFPPEPPDYPVLFITKTRDAEKVIPWGIVLMYED